MLKVLRVLKVLPVMLAPRVLLARPVLTVLMEPLVLLAPKVFKVLPDPKVVLALALSSKAKLPTLQLYPLLPPKDTLTSFRARTRCGSTLRPTLGLMAVRSKDHKVSKVLKAPLELPVLRVLPVLKAPKAKPDLLVLKV